MNPEDEQIGCGFCSKKRRVLNAYELKIGQHICEPGRHTLKYKEKKHSTKAFYNHHAIIAEIKERTDYQVTLVLIHYTDVTGFKRGVIKKTEEKRDLKYHEIYLVEYNFAKYTPEEIICRAESQAKDEGNDAEKTENADEDHDECNDKYSRAKENEAIDSEELDKDTVVNDENQLLGTESGEKDIKVRHGFAATEDKQSNDDKSVFGDYNLFKSNCEHLATWCVVGKQDCFQLEQKRKVLLFPLRLSSGPAGIFILIISAIYGLFASIFSEDQTAVPGISLLVVVSIYLIHFFISFFQLRRNHKYKYLCSFCYNEKTNNKATKFIWCMVSGILTYMIIQRCIQLMSPWYVTILTNVICALISAFAQWLYRDIKSPFVSNYSKADELSNIKKGDIIFFKQYGFSHYAIATKVTSSTISVVHYKGFLFNSVIIEEKIRWPEVTIWTLDLGRMTRYSAEEVISRIQQRLGEKKWHWRLNRSDHVCYWAIKKQLHFKNYTTWTNNRTTQTTKETTQKTYETTQTTKETIQKTDETTQTTKETTLTTDKTTQTTEYTTQTTDKTTQTTEYTTQTTDETTQTTRDTTQATEEKKQTTDITTQTTGETTQTYEKTAQTTNETTQTIETMHTIDETTQTTKETTQTTVETDTKTKEDQIHVLSSFEVENVVVHLGNEIEIGDVVEFFVNKGKIRKGEGIVIAVHNSAAGLFLDSRSFQLYIVMQEGRYITKSLINIDLNIDTVRVKKFHPVHSNSMEKRRKKALSIPANEKKDRKYNFVEFCVLKENRNIAVCDIEGKKNK